MGCITNDVKEHLAKVIEKGCPENASGIKFFLDVIPECDPSMFKAAVKEGSSRSAPTPWGASATYVDKDGKKTEYSSPSNLVKALGLKMSGSQQICDGTSCKAASVIDILQLNGYTVWGDGSDIPVEKGKTTHITVFRAAPAVEKTPKKEK
ncbi:MAG: hypothetical protein WC794_06305 [Candidatus Doudnabacteria bacterium]